MDDDAVAEFIAQGPRGHQVNVAGFGQMVAGDNNHRFWNVIESFVSEVA